MGQDSSARTAQPLVESPYVRSLIAGALAGTTVDTSLYPLDTLKTRLQSSTGFWASGGFRGVYSGIGSAALGSAPGAALFFVTYEGVKNSAFVQRNLSGGADGGGGALGHMLAASLGEVAACAVRVPTEVVKQRAQARQQASSRAALMAILELRKSKGLGFVWRELYRGWSVTIMREVPFTVVQFPLWEGLKRWRGEQRARAAQSAAVGLPGSAEKSNAPSVTALESALFGSVSGAIAAGLTTPLDVLKTRMMLAAGERESVFVHFNRVLKNEGAGAFFKGIGPRTTWISIGGAVFLGSYQWAANALAGTDVLGL